METSIEVSYTRLSLIYFTDLGKINFPTKIDYRIKLHLEKEMKILFESKNFWQLELQNRRLVLK